MKMKAILILMLVCSLTRFDAAFAKPSKKKHENFKIHILEKGTEYEQEVDLDEDEHIVTVHVPAHNDVDETYFITDTRKHLTMRVTVQQKICFLTKNDPDELPRPDVWRTNKNMLINDAESTKQITSYLVSGALSSTETKELPSKMQEMCNGLNIAWIQPMNMDSPEYGQDSEMMPKMTTYINYTSVEANRVKRQIDGHGRRYRDYCAANKKAQKCVVFENSCYHVMDCIVQVNHQGRESARCEKKKHVYEDVRCCIACCLDDVPEWNPSPSCNLNFGKEQICPTYDFV